MSQYPDLALFQEVMAAKARMDASQIAGRDVLETWRTDPARPLSLREAGLIAEHYELSAEFWRASITWAEFINQPTAEAARWLWECETIAAQIRAGMAERN